MPSVFYVLDKKEVEADAGQTILMVSLRAGIPHAHACGGTARCSTCRVLIVEGLEHCAPPNDKEQKLAETLHFSPEIRLGCQTTISGDVKLRRLVIDAEDVELTDQAGAASVPSPIGEQEQLAVLFADIRGFTPFAESLPPYDVVHALNRYYHHVGQAITRNGGSIDNYMGDGLMALFGVSDSTAPALQAVKTGLDMLKEVEGLKPYLQAIYARSFDIGIGVHYGDVVVGAIGADDMKRVTAIGDTVNMASRIQAANKAAGTRFLISEETYLEVKERVVAGRKIRVTLPGKSGQYTLYEVVGLSAQD